MQIISSLPRFNSAGEKVSANMGDFDWVVCNNDNTDCKFLDVDWNKEIQEPAGPTSPISYAQSITLYAALPLPLFFLTFLCCFCFSFSRCVCRCRAGICGCGKTYPTDRSKGCCPCGFKKNRDPTLEAERRFHYPRCEAFCVRICMVVFALTIL